MSVSLQGTIHIVLCYKSVIKSNELIEFVCTFGECVLNDKYLVGRWMGEETIGFYSEAVV